MGEEVEKLVERLPYIAAVLEANAGKFAVPDHIPAKVATIREAAATLLRLQGELLEAIEEQNGLRDRALERTVRAQAAEAQVEVERKVAKNAERQATENALAHFAAASQVEAMRKVLEEFWRLCLVIDSAVRADQPHISADVRKLTRETKRLLFDGPKAAALSAPAEERSSSRDHAPTLRAALEGLLAAAKEMPRRTPAPGGASTEHPFQIMAAHVWANDRACQEAELTLAFLPGPATAKAEESAVYPDWQPIETLPREWISFGEGGDGTWHSDWCLFGRKHENGHFVSWVGLLDADHWLGRQDDGCCFDTEAPTHWMPLLAAPAEARSEQAPLIDCPRCDGSGFSGYGTGYDAVCDHCGGQQQVLAQAEANREANHGR